MKDFPKESCPSVLGSNRILKTLTDYLGKRSVAVALAFGMLAWILWLRAPSFPALMWNVDETIHATIAEVLLDGGVLYRDAIDQRTPVSYYVVAAIFGLTGSSLPATRIFFAILVAATAVLLGRTAWRVNGPFTGVAAALVFAAFANYLLMPYDTFAIHTEWLVVFFTTGAAWVFLAGPQRVPTLARSWVAGGLLGFAFMTKPSALLELAPALAGLMALVMDRELSWRQSLQRAASLVGGFIVIVIVVCLPLVWAGAGRDLLYYAWIYNVEIYGAEYTFAEKVSSSRFLFEKIARTYPFLLATGIGGGVWLLIRCLQSKPRPVAHQRRFGQVFLLTWCITSLGGAMAGGRGFDHYFLPTLVPFAWVAAMGPARWLRQIVEQTSHGRMARALLMLLVAAGVYSVTWPPLAARSQSLPPPDSALRVSTWVREQSDPQDRIFVWGFNPDIYHYTDRLPASRFIYCTFQTGLVPWTNIAPHIDTAYARVEGAMTTLLRDLDARPPRYIIDSSAGPHRFWGKYPLANFPDLETWINRSYVELEGGRWRGQGYRLLARADEPVAPNPPLMAEDSSHQPSIFGNDRLAPGWNFLDVAANAPEGRQVTGLALKCDGELVGSTRFTGLPDIQMRVAFEITKDEDRTSADLQALVQFDEGDWQAAAIVNLPVVAAVISEEDRIAYAIPLISKQVEASGIRAAFGAGTETYQGRKSYTMHAPALLVYQLPAEARLLRGKFGLAAAAYADHNPTPSDGAEFIVRVRHQDGTMTKVFHQFIHPRTNELDRKEHYLEVDLPAHTPGDQLELEIAPGPSGVTASDWTHWRELELATSR